MGYDSRDRLTAAVAPGLWGNASYSYDGLDNLTQADQGARKYRYAYASNQHLSQINDPNGITQFTFGYDAAGNVSLKNNQAYGFDSAHRLTQVTGLQSYRYDGLGRRVQTTDADGSTTFWQYSQAGQVLYASEARKHRNTAYIYLGNTQVAAWHIAWGGGPVTIEYEHTDALGSPVAQTDPTGAVTSRSSYTPYGEAFNAPIDGPGYTGHVMDAATGLTYMQQRYYDPTVGTFLSVDPMDVDTAAAFNFNRYDYASDNPYRFTDPDGRADSEDRIEPPKVDHNSLSANGMVKGQNGTFGSARSVFGNRNGGARSNNQTWIGDGGKARGKGASGTFIPGATGDWSKNYKDPNAKLKGGALMGGIVGAGIGMKIIYGLMAVETDGLSLEGEGLLNTLFNLGEPASTIGVVGGTNGAIYGSVAGGAAGAAADRAQKDEKEK